MSRGESCWWGLFLAGLPFAHFLLQPVFPTITIFHAQTLWAELFFVLIWGRLLWGHALQPLPSNPFFACWWGWAGLLLCVAWQTTLSKAQVYPVGMLPYVLHYILIVLLYVAMVVTWTTQLFERLLHWLAWSGVLVLGYCGLQLLQLDQFYRDLEHPRNLLVGTMGNPSHLATYLALLMPIYLWKGSWWRALVGVVLLVIVLTHSIGGLLAAFVGMVVWMHMQGYHRESILLVLGGLGIGAWLCWSDPDAWNAHGRWEAWQAFYPFFKQKAITGWGPGWVFEHSRAITEGPIFQWRHVHNEWYQAAIEFGVIGLGCLLAALGHWGRQLWAVRKTPLGSLCLAMMVIGCVNSLVNFTLHLWGTGSLVLVAYCGGLVVTREAHALNNPA